MSCHTRSLLGLQLGAKRLPVLASRFLYAQGAPSTTPQMASPNTATSTASVAGPQQMPGLANQSTSDRRTVLSHLTVLNVDINSPAPTAPVAEKAMSPPTHDMLELVGTTNAGLKTWQDRPLAYVSGGATTEVVEPAALATVAAVAKVAVVKGTPRPSEADLAMKVPIRLTNGRRIAPSPPSPPSSACRTVNVYLSCGGLRSAQ